MDDYVFNPFEGGHFDAVDVLSISDAIISGTPGSVLFIDSNGNVAQDNLGITYIPGTGLALDDDIAMKGQLFIDGDTDQIQLLVQGHSTQTNFLATFEQSDGTDVLTIANDGDLISAGSGRFDGGLNNASDQLVVNLVSTLLIDVSDFQSMDWTNRTLNSPGGNQILNWNSDGLAEFGDNNIITIGDLFIGSDLSARVNIDGKADEIQLLVQGHSTQNNPLATFEQFDGTDAVTISNGGDIVAIGDITSNKNFKLLASVSVTVGNLEIDDKVVLHSFGTQSVFVGAEAGNYTFTGAGKNTGIGRNALNALTTGSENMAIGEGAGEDITIGIKNVNIGASSGTNLTTGSSNMLIGHASFAQLTTGSNNIGIGRNAGADAALGSKGNVAIGGTTLFHISGTNTDDVDDNVVIGFLAVSDFVNSPINNVIIGHGAGVRLGGDGNVWLGHDAMATNTTLSNSLGIDNTNTTTPLIYGEFDNREVHIHGHLEIGEGAAGVDYTLIFDGQTNDGLLTWMEDEDRFDFADILRGLLRVDAYTSRDVIKYASMRG